MSKPNIVFIMADDMGYGDVTCYNSESRIPTPNIDRLAKEGVMFTDAHSSCAFCTPTRYGLLTGRYYWRTPKKHSLVMPYEPPTIEPERPTIASMLKSRGYTTGCVGKWHLGLLYPTRDGVPTRYTQVEEDVDFSKPLDGGPLELGFDYFFGTAGCSTSDPPYCFIENDRTVGIPSIHSTEDLHALPGFMVGTPPHATLRIARLAKRRLPPSGRLAPPRLLCPSRGFLGGKYNHGHRPWRSGGGPGWQAPPVAPIKALDPLVSPRGPPGACPEPFPGRAVAGTAACW